MPHRRHTLTQQSAQRAAAYAAPGVAKRKGPDGKPLSAGFGFVECCSEEVAKLGISKIQVGLFLTVTPTRNLNLCLPLPDAFEQPECLCAGVQMTHGTQEEMVQDGVL